MKTKGKKVGIFIRGTPRLLIVGEAPGPRGASITGYPFWGDISGRQIYQLFFELGLMREARFRPTSLGGKRLPPPAGDYALSNAFDRMPWDEKKNKFRAPTLMEIKSQSSRLRNEILKAQPPAILAVGLSAARAVDFSIGSHLVHDKSGLNLAILRNLDERGQTMSLGATTCKVFLTFHPSYGQWQRPGTGDLHRKVVKLIQKFI